MNGGSAARWREREDQPEQRGRVRVTSLGLDLQAEGGATRQVDPRRLLAVEARGDELHVELAAREPGAASTRLVIEDRSLLAPLLLLRRAAQAPPAPPPVIVNEPSVGSRPPLGLLALLVAALLLGWAGWVGLGQAYRLVPPDLERRLGELAHAQLVQDSAVLHAPELEGWLDDMARQLLDEDTPFEPRIEILDADEPNAFALPGGRIVVQRGLFELAGSPEAVAGVLAHELVHVEQRHGLRQLLRSLGLAAALGAVFGGGEAVVAGGRQLLELSHSRDAESEADALAARKLQRAGHSVAGLLGFLRAVQAEGGELPGALGWLSTHPASAERIAALEQLLAGERLSPRAWVSERAAWDAAVAGLGAAPSRDAHADEPR